MGLFNKDKKVNFDDERVVFPYDAIIIRRGNFGEWQAHTSTNLYNWRYFWVSRKSPIEALLELVRHANNYLKPIPTIFEQDYLSAVSNERLDELEQNPDKMTFEEAKELITECLNLRELLCLKDEKE